MRFEVVEKVVAVNDTGHQIYGIACIDEAKVCHTFSELTHKLEAANAFAKDLNELQPDFSQLEYIIEDFYVGQN